MEARFSPRVKDVISYSREEALRLGHDYMGVEHLLLGIIREGEGMAIKIMKSLGVDIPDLRKQIESSIKVSSGKSLNLNQIPLVKQAEKALKVTYLEARLFKTSLIGTEHLLLAILKDEDNIVTKTLEKFNVDYTTVRDELKNLLTEEPRAQASNNPLDDDNDDDAGSFGGGGTKKSD